MRQIPSREANSRSANKYIPVRLISLRGCFTTLSVARLYKAEWMADRRLTSWMGFGSRRSWHEVVCRIRWENIMKSLRRVARPTFEPGALPPGQPAPSLRLNNLNVHHTVHKSTQLA